MVKKRKTAGKTGSKNPKLKSGLSSQKKLCCDLPLVLPRQLPGGIEPGRQSFILSMDELWVNGTVIHYCFFDHTKHGSPKNWTGKPADLKVVRKAFKEWKNLGIGLEFNEVKKPEDAEIRIGFLQDNRSWSYVGTYPINKLPSIKRTMNFGWDLTTSHGYDTAVHEIGHGIGAKHEHQNPVAGIDWDEPEVYDYFKGFPNFWSKKQIDHNILKKIPVASVDGSTWDPDSIMHYDFNAPLIDGPSPYDKKGIHPKPGLSKNDKLWARKFYPPLTRSDYIDLIPFQSRPVVLSEGEQVNFVIKPSETRKYNIQTFGNVDTIMVLFEDDGSEPRYLTADDDSGTENNAKIEYRLLSGRTYFVRVRLFYDNGTGETAVMIW